MPVAGKVEQIITGSGGWGIVNFYNRYSGSNSTSQKPFIITETGSTVHLAVSRSDGSWVAPANSDEVSRGKEYVLTVVSIKRTWWRQMLNADFLKRFRKIKAVCFFEFIKFEEKSWRE